MIVNRYALAQGRTAKKPQMVGQEDPLLDDLARQKQGPKPVQPGTPPAPTAFAAPKDSGPGIEDLAAQHAQMQQPKTASPPPTAPGIDDLAQQAIAARRGAPLTAPTSPQGTGHAMAHGGQEPARDAPTPRQGNFHEATGPQVQQQPNVQAQARGAAGTTRTTPPVTQATMQPVAHGDRGAGHAVAAPTTSQVPHSVVDDADKAANRQHAVDDYNADWEKRRAEEDAARARSPPKDPKAAHDAAIAAAKLAKEAAGGDLTGLAKQQADHDKELAAKKADLEHEKAQAIMGAGARTGLAGMGLSGATSGILGDVANAATRNEDLTLADLARQQSAADFADIQRKAATWDAEEAAGYDLDNDGITGSPAEDAKRKADKAKADAALALAKNAGDAANRAAADSGGGVVRNPFDGNGGTVDVTNNDEASNTLHSTNAVVKREDVPHGSTGPSHIVQDGKIFDRYEGPDGKVYLVDTGRTE